MPALAKPRWETFCLAYVYGPTAGNGRASYRAAGYNASPHSAAAEAYKLLQFPEVRGRIAELQAEAAHDSAATTAHTAAQLGLGPDRVLVEMSKLAFSNMLDYFHFDETGKATLDLAWIERDKAAAIVDAIVHLAPDGSVSRLRIKLADKRAALVDIGRHFGMFVERKYVDEQEIDPAAEAEMERRIAIVIREIAEERLARAAVSFVMPPAAESEPKSN